MSEIWNRLKNEPAVAIGSVEAVLQVLVWALPSVTWLSIVLSAVVAVAGVVGIRSQVTPV